MSRNIDLSIGEYYHLYNRGTDKREIFLDYKDKNRFLSLLYLCNSTEAIHLSDYPNCTLQEILEIVRGESFVDIGAYCLMPNHFHILIKEKVENGISLFMQKLSTGYTSYFNKKQNRTGSLFEGRFKAKHLDNDEYLKYQFSYIHLNPIGIIDSNWKEKNISDKHKAKEFLKKYTYSSYLDYMGVKRIEGKIISKEAFPEYFESVTDFDKLINFWLNYNEENVKVEP